MSAPVRPPAHPVAVTGWPIRASTDATLTPLPPARSRTAVTRLLACGTSSSTS